MEVLTSVLYIFLVYIVYKLCDHIYRKPTLFSVTSRRIFITGCDTGFGYELAKRLDIFGCHVFAACLTEQGEADLKACCSKRLQTVRMDVTDPTSIRKAYSQVVKMLPEGFGLWGLVNNAGIAGALGPAEWLQLKDYNRVLDVNLLGMINVTTTFLPLIKLCKGRIVNTASIAGRMSFENTTPYCVAKFGVECYSDALRREMADFGVSVHVLEPGLFNTNINNLDDYERLHRQTWDQASEDVKAEYGEEYVKKFIKVSIRGFIPMIMSNNIDKVVTTYVHSLLAYFPRARYVVGFDAGYFFLPIQWLPEWFSDWLLYALAKHRPKPRVLQTAK